MTSWTSWYLGDVEIGLNVTEGKLTILETPAHIKVGGGPEIAKQELADLIGCEPADKCWSVALSRKPRPFKLHLCSHKDEPGHEAWDSDMHTFTPAQIRLIKEFVHQQTQVAPEAADAE